MCNHCDSSGKNGARAMDDMEHVLQLQHRLLFDQRQIGLHHHRLPENSRRNSGWPASGLQLGPPLPQRVKVQLHNRKLWDKFHGQTTEMIITKLGRRMFPSMQLEVSGMERGARYCILLEVAPSSRHRHKYVGTSNESVSTRNGEPGTTGWTSAGPAEPQSRLERRIYLHPDSPATGSHWMQHPIGFGKLKLTNNAVDHRNNVVLTSMHKYIPRIWIVRCDDANDIADFYSHPASSFTFSETEFIAVTAYQNENITKLKIENNPFAKGFRESGQSRCKRKLRQPEEHSPDLCKKNRLEEENGEKEEDEDSNLDSVESEANCTERRRENADSAESEARSKTSPKHGLYRPWTTDYTPSLQSAETHNRLSSIPTSNFFPPLSHFRPTSMLNEDSILPAYVRYFYPFFLDSSATELQRYHQQTAPFAKF